jgi:hypothetical protein
VGGYAFEASVAIVRMPAAARPAARFGFSPYGASAAPLAVGGSAAVPAAAVSVTLSVIGPDPSSVGASAARARVATRAHAAVPAGRR